MKQEIDNDKLTETRTEEEEMNPCQKVVLNNIYKDNYINNSLETLI